MIFIKRIAFLLFFITMTLSCEKGPYTTIPYAQVYLELKLENLDSDLRTSLAYKEYTQKRFETDRLGVGGILVINGMGENQINLFAFDLSCPVEIDRNIRVIPDNLSSSTAAVKTAITATCPKCGAVFNIVGGTGSPKSGTKYYLRSYRVSGSGMQFVVTN